jgi:hypothetical protein
MATEDKKMFFDALIKLNKKMKTMETDWMRKKSYLMIKKPLASLI